MPRYRLLIEYDGGPFQGWQSQPGVPTVQDAIETAVFALCGERVRVSGAGRTDAGVHAAGQVGHLDMTRGLAPERLCDALNAHLRPKPIAILGAEIVPEAFDARFSAIRRVYRYTILNRRAPPALAAGRVWHVVRHLDVEAMHRAAQALVGRHDFTAFRNADCQAKSPLRTLDRICLRRDGDVITAETAARAFLHNQVRSMIGSLKRVGEGAWPESAIAEILAARDRARCGALAPPAGLSLVRVDYPPTPPRLAADEEDGDGAPNEAK